MVVCNYCGRNFKSENALRQHCFDKTDHPYCKSCQRIFTNKQELRQHFRARTDHPYCETCDHIFTDQEALQQHLDRAAVHQDAGSDTSEDAYCLSCNRLFVSRKLLYQHLRASLAHNWCFICSKDFVTRHALAQHNSSRVHKAADIKCPLCPRVFKAPSDIAEHIEKGGCDSRITRHHVTAAVHAMNIVPTISINRRIAGPATGLITTYSATELAFNGKAYECYLCHRQFGTLGSLNAHLGSAAHDAKEFKCPHVRCKRKFTIISALIRHIESEACGAAKFVTVERWTNALTDQFSRLLKF